MSKATLHAKLKNPEYRHEFVSANIDAGIAFQIRALREQREWSQQELGRRIGRKPGQEQPGISKLETVGHAFSLATLKKLAEAFDVALVIRFVPFSEAANWVSSLGPGFLEVASFREDKGFAEETASETTSTATTIEVAPVATPARVLSAFIGAAEAKVDFTPATSKRAARTSSAYHVGLTSAAPIGRMTNA